VIIFEGRSWIDGVLFLFILKFFSKLIMILLGENEKNSNREMFANSKLFADLGMSLIVKIGYALL
jgi:hypothetical protein